MAGRTGEKIGWIAGWCGGFIWVVILSVVFFFQGKWVQGVLGLVLTVAASASVVFFAPWRFPRKPYWLLLFAPYGMFFLSVAWAIGSYGGPGAARLSWWNLLWILPLMIPFGVMRNGKWADSETGDTTPGTKEPEEPEESKLPSDEEIQPDSLVEEKKTIWGKIKKVWSSILSRGLKLFRRKKR